MIEVVVNDRTGKKIRVKCEPTDTIGNLKKLVAAQVGTRPDKLVIKRQQYNVLKDHITLEDYEVADGSSLELKGGKRSRGGNEKWKCMEPPSDVPFFVDSEGNPMSDQLVQLELEDDDEDRERKFEEFIKTGLNLVSNLNPNSEKDLNAMSIRENGKIDNFLSSEMEGGDGEEGSNYHHQIMDTEDLSKFILESLEKGKKDSLDANNDNQNTDNDSPFSTENMKIDQQIILGVLKSLTSHDIINFNVVEKESWNLTLEGNDILSLGSHEVRVFNMISMQKSIQEINDALGEYAKIGQSKAFKNKWIRQVPLEEEKGSNGGYRLEGCVQSVQDETREQLIKISKGEMVDSSIIQDLKRRKLIILEKNQHFLVTKGKSFSLNIQKQATDLTCEMIKTGSWMSEQFKKYNYNACGSNIPSGNLHPLLKVREEFRQIFLQMGFEEMPTNRFVESSFWNFDALFQPQQHPARDAHDTFFLKNPEFANSLPKDYMRATREIHENGGFGSTGYQCKWEEKEALKNIMRTHTTAISSQMLYNLAKESVFKPAKYFSIDRVYRNETLDATHLAEFHQIEGLIVDHDLTLGDLIGTLKAFFSRLGIEKLRFKPAYNPYTEPSMEIFAYHPGLKRWIELGNSGIFRPEMLRPMGFDERVRVIAWGLSLERPTMIKYGLSNIRELVGHKVDLAIVRSNPICRLEK